MEVIEHGNPRKKINYSPSYCEKWKLVKFSCGCGCVFVADKTEYKIQRHLFDYDEYVISCPECGRRVCKDKFGIYLPFVG